MIENQKAMLTKYAIENGLLYCADCGARLTYNSGNKPKPKSYYFMCSSYRRHKDGDCILPHRIREIVLDEIVREEINQANISVYEKIDLNFTKFSCKFILIFR